MKESAGTLLYRFRDGALQVLIVHPSGAYNRRAPWSIPKGKLDPGETLEAAARRETVEETGVRAGELVDLGSVELAAAGSASTASRGPPPRTPSRGARRGRWTARSSWGSDRARELLHPDQAPFVDWLVTLVRLRPDLRTPGRAAPPRSAAISMYPDAGTRASRRETIQTKG